MKGEVGKLWISRHGREFEISLGQWGKYNLKKVVLFKSSIEGSGELMATNL